MNPSISFHEQAENEFNEAADIERHLLPYFFHSV